MALADTAVAISDGTVALSSGQIQGMGPATADGALALPRAPSLGLRLTFPRLRVELGPLAGRVVLGSMVAGVLAIVVFSTAGPSALVPSSYLALPTWEAGPLHLLTHGLHVNARAMGYGLSGLLVLLSGAYGVALASVRRLSPRSVVIAVAALHAILLLGPPLQLTDLFNYLGYARLGGLHGLNPYRHVIAEELHDPVYVFATWRHLHSPYGPLFTAAGYGLGRLPLPVAYWLLKTVTVAASLGFLGLLGWCARRLGRDPRIVLVFVALNPIYLVYAVGGFHNDFFMLLPAMGSIALLLAGRHRSAGAVLVGAVAVKFTAIILLPFLILGTRAPAHRRQILLGAGLLAAPLLAGYLVLFGNTVANLSDQSSLVTPFSIPNLTALAVGAGPALLHLADGAVAVIVALLVWKGRHWLSSAGWATLALLAGLSWLMPWYVVWALPLAALAADRRLRRATVAFSLFLVLTFLPVDSVIMRRLHLNPMSSQIGELSQARQLSLTH